MVQIFLPLLLVAASCLSAPSTAAVAIAAQTDPAKLATLKGERAANPRMQRCVYWLAWAEAAGEKPEAVLDGRRYRQGQGISGQKWAEIQKVTNRQTLRLILVGKVGTNLSKYG